MTKSISPDSILVKSELEKIISDNLSGSDELQCKLNSYFLNYYQNIEFTNDFFKFLEQSFNSFTSILYYLKELQELVGDENKSQLLKFLNNFGKNKNIAYNLIYSKLKVHLKKNISIITISNSNTIFEITRLIKKEYNISKIIVCESRPQFEGRILAERFAGIGLNVILITEASLPEYVNNCDVALIGADKLLSNGNVINKTGSKLLGIVCKYFNKPYIVLSDSSKFNDSEFVQDKQPAKEIFENSNNNITVKNYYFEEIDKELITKIITDKNQPF